MEEQSHGFVLQPVLQQVVVVHDVAALAGDGHALNTQTGSDESHNGSGSAVLTFVGNYQTTACSQGILGKGVHLKAKHQPIPLIT